MATATEIQKWATKYAKQDLNIAKKSGLMAICDTKKGNVEIEYNYETKRFTASNFNNTSIVYKSNATTAEMIEFVSSIYIFED